MKNSKFKTTKMTQRHERRMAKIGNKGAKQLAKIQGHNTASKTKIITGEVGRTVRSVASNMAANKGAETISATTKSILAEKNANNNQNSIDLYNKVIAGLGIEGQQGQTQKDSTTEVGGSGSKLGG